MGMLLEVWLRVTSCRLRVVVGSGIICSAQPDGGDVFRRRCKGSRWVLSSYGGWSRRSMIAGERERPR